MNVLGRPGRGAPGNNPLMALERQVDLFQLAEDCGCGAKLPAADLREILSGLLPPHDPRLIIGPDTYDDAAVYRLSNDCLLVQTVDFFPPVARDPQVFGRIAAANALSDVYAMGGRPLTALALMCLPAKQIPLPVARCILDGAIQKLAEAGALLVGGHTLEDPQLKFGLAVTGIVEPERLLSNAKAQPGDLLVLTKPLGAGLTIMATKAGLAAERQIQESVRWMAALNHAAADAAISAGGHAATDVTGFGLLGHAWQMTKASAVQMTFHAGRIPVTDGAEEFASMGLVPAGAYANRQFLEGHVRFADQVPLTRQDLLFDPQTSGGLLLSLPPLGLETFRQAALGHAECCCAVVGEVQHQDEEPRLFVEL
jgi:selenide,water dikinase